MENVLGSNQENAAYPSGLCAERVAIFHASYNRCKKFKDGNHRSQIQINNRTNPTWSLQAINSRIRNPTRDLIEIYFKKQAYKSDS
jgi:hypothetical protein